MRTSRSFGIPIGRNLGRGGGLGGYYIDFTIKAADPSWPPAAATAAERHLHVTTAQWGLGCIERHLDGEGPSWLAGARRAAHHLASEQTGDGGWPHSEAYPHTFDLQPPWLSAMAQGEGASLLARVAELADEPELLAAARAAIEPLLIAGSDGGLSFPLPEGGALPQEYPTNPPSHVLNGGIFALWGIRDLAEATDDRVLRDAFETGVDALAANIEQWDTGYWSRYDLFPHPVRNLASPAYHELHIDQLTVIQELVPRPEIDAALERFRAYADSALGSRRAFASKVLFRLAVPRNQLLARRMPWSR